MELTPERSILDQVREATSRPPGGGLWPFRVVGVLLVGALVVVAALAVISDQSTLSWFAVAVVGLLGGLTYWLGVSSQERQMEQQRRYLGLLAVMATHDDLTGLYNRRYLYDRLREEWLRWQRYRRPFSVILFDVDDLKAINDTHGHTAGDEVLRHVAACLRFGTRSSDVAARWGGDEFAVLVPETDEPQAEHLAARLQRLVASAGAPLAEAARNHLTVRVSYGTTTANERFQRPEDIFAAADESLYAARRSTRDAGKPQAPHHGPSSPGA